MAKPGSPPFHPQQALGEAVALHRQGRLDEAEKIYTRVLKAQRDQFDALHLLGMLNHQRGKAGEAFRLINAALKVDPRSADALSNLALVLHALKRDGDALASLDKALAITPGHPDALNNRGTILLDLKRPADAVAAFDEVLAREPRHPQARVNRGNALVDLDRAVEALADYDVALAAAPGHPLALYNRGNALRLLGREADAIASYNGALAAMPRHVRALHNRGLALQALNRHQEAIKSFDAALALQPDYADAHFNKAAALLTLGDYPRGLPEYEWRWKRSGMGAVRSFRQPLWLGQSSLAGKTILLHAEQGLGDTIHFVRYAPLLARQDAKVVLEVQPELAEVVAGMDSVSAVVARGENLPPFDVQCPLASLPLACKTEWSNIPAPIPYLHPSEVRLAHWRPRIEALSSPRIAIAWSGRASHANDRNRTLAFSQLEPLLALPGRRFISVQHDPRTAEAAALANDARIAHVGGELADFADTAAVLGLADLVICVDTSVAHLAAALGRPTWVLLPFQPDWRWGLDHESSPWYPAARLFRQPRPGDWTSVINRLCEALASWPMPVT